MAPYKYVYCHCYYCYCRCCSSCCRRRRCCCYYYYYKRQAGGWRRYIDVGRQLQPMPSAYIRRASAGAAGPCRWTSTPRCRRRDCLRRCPAPRGSRGFSPCCRRLSTAALNRRWTAADGHGRLQALNHARQAATLPVARGRIADTAVELGCKKPRFGDI